MRDVTPEQPSRGTERTPTRTAPQHTRIHQTINNISEFFRPRIRHQPPPTITIINTTPNPVATIPPISSFFRPRSTSLPARATPTSTRNNITNINNGQQATPATTIQQSNIPATLIPVQVITNRNLLGPQQHRNMDSTIETHQSTIGDTPSIASEAAATNETQQSTSTLDGTQLETPLDRLQRAQEIWTAMFQSHTNTPNADGNRPIALSVENQRSNEPWGDELGPKSESITRIYGMNVNGLRLDQRGGQLDVLSNVIKEVQADVFCGQEHNLECNHTSVKQVIYHTTRQHWRRSRAIFGTTPIIFPKQYKPGGTFMLTNGNITSRIIDQQHDKWGRWVSQTFQGKRLMKLRIYSVYQAVDATIKIGSITIAAQQQSLLMQMNDTETNPRAAFRRDLTL